MTAFSLQTEIIVRPLKAPIKVATHSWDINKCLVVTATNGSHTGRGEGCCVFYRDETIEGLKAQIDTITHHITGPKDRARLAELLPANGARAALDHALWDLEAKATGTPVWQLAGVSPDRPVLSANTIFLDEPAAMARQANNMAGWPLVKIKLGAEGDVDRLKAVRRALPDTRLIVDANAGWDEPTLEAMTPYLMEAGVEMVEQPLPPGQDACLDDYDSPLLSAADESFQTAEDLDHCARRYGMINVKLDKCGGLTAALAIRSLAEAMGLKVMVGGMLNSSLGMAPAHVFGRDCDLADLDGPLGYDVDEQPKMTFQDGHALPPDRALWG